MPLADELNGLCISLILNFWLVIVLFFLTYLAATTFGLNALCADPAIEFLPDDAEVSCRAILPQCFTRRGWAQLCRADPTIRHSFVEACDLAVE